MPTSPTAPSAVPDFPAIGDASYNSKAFAWATHMDATYPTEMQALATNVYNNAVEADADATTATTKAAEAVAASLAATTTANASAWVNGGTYALNANAISGVDFQTYRKKTASSVTTTDPSADGANWVQVGGSTIGTGGTTSTASITLTAASPAAMSVTPATPGLYVTLPDATTCTKADNLYSVYNAGDYDYGVKDSAGTQLGWIRARTGAMIGLADNSTAAGVWAYYGLEKTGITARYLNASTAGLTSSNNMPIRSVAIDSNRSFLLFGYADCYGIVYDASTQTWGAATLIRSSVGSAGSNAQASCAILSAANQILVCTCDSTTGFQAVTLTISSTSITVNTPVATTLSNNIYFSTGAGVSIIAVSTSFVVMYGVQTATNVEIRALTVSGTVPTIGAASTLSSGTQYPGVMYASGSIVRTLVGNATNTLYCKPFTVSGSTLSAGTEASASSTNGYVAKSFVNGNGNIVAYSVATSSLNVSIFKLTGTVEAVSTQTSVITCSANSNVDAAQISTSKTAFFGTDGATSWGCNIVTDTAGTASKGTAVTGTAPGNASNPAFTALSGSVANFTVYATVAIVRAGFDCSGSSPTVSTIFETPYNSAAAMTAIPQTSNVYSGRSFATLVAGTSAYHIGWGYPFYLQATANTLVRIRPTENLGIGLPIGTGFAVPGTTNASWITSGRTASAGANIILVEAAA